MISIETLGGFYITQIKQLQDRIFERFLSEQGLKISGGQGRILFVLWKQSPCTISEISQRTSLAKNTVSIMIDTDGRAPASCGGKATLTIVVKH